MSLGPCIPQLLGEGKLTAEQAAEAEGLFTELKQDLRRQFGDQAADAMATDAALKALQAKASRKRYLAAKTIATRQRLEFELRGGGSGGSDGNGGSGPINPALGPAVFTFREGAGFANLEGRYQAISRRSKAYIAALLQKHHTDLLGRVRKEAELDDVGRAIMGETVESAEAKAMAQGWLEGVEYSRQRFNAAGGNIGRLRDGRGYLPQSNDPMKVRQVPYEEWRADRLAGLDREAMIDRSTGRPFSDAALELQMREDWEQIRSNGWFAREPGGIGSGATANRRGDPRFYIAKDFDSWKAYNDKYGRGTLYEAMLGHLDSISSDTAAMEVLGPNPEATVRWIKQLIEKDAEIAPDTGQAIKRASPEVARIDALWREYSGLNARPGREWLSNTGRAIRSYETARTLGSAVLSAVPGDLGTQHVAAAMWDLPFTKVLQNQMKLLNPADPSHRLLAARQGLIFEGWTNRSAASMRALGGDDLGAGRMGLIAEGVLRSSGLSAWTDSGQSAFGMTVFGHMADVRKVPFTELDKGFRELLERGGIDAKDWDAIRATPITREKGQDWLFAQDIKDPALGDKVLSLVAEAENLAVQEAGFETRAIMRDSMKAGTAIGEVGKTALLLKSFGISMILTHGRRMMAMGNWKQRASYTARLFITLTLAGAVTIQLREIAKGRDPKPMDTPEFWTNASLQGGGWGMIGDLLKLVSDPRLDSTAKWLAGPAADTLAKSFALEREDWKLHGYALGLADKPDNYGTALNSMLRDQLPGGNLWYARTAFNRVLLDQLRMETDPDYAAAFRRMEQAADEEGTDFFWRPGEVAPDRAPSLQNIVMQPQGSEEP